MQLKIHVHAARQINQQRMWPNVNRTEGTFVIDHTSAPTEYMYMAQWLSRCTVPLFDTFFNNISNTCLEDKNIISLANRIDYIQQYAKAERDL